MIRDMTMTRIRFLLVGSVLLLGLFAVSQAWGQGGEETQREGVAERSFAGAFFWSHRIDANGRETVEWLGSGVIWFLLGLNVFSLGLMGRLSWENTRNAMVPPDMVVTMSNLLDGGKYKEAIEAAGGEGSHFSRLMHAALEEAKHGYGAMMRRLEQSGEELTTHRLRSIEHLNVLGQVSPMIGLFGTVYGMILAFQGIVLAGGNADPVLLAGGIGTALTTTFWGLVVAIPALAGYAVIRNRVDELSMEAMTEAEGLLGRFRPRPASQGHGSEVRSESGGDEPPSAGSEGAGGGA